MISEQKYYCQLNEQFIEKNMKLFKKVLNLEKKWGRERKDQSYIDLIQFLNKIEKKYGFNMQKMCDTNFLLLSLFQITFQGKLNSKQREVALKFLITCCLIDKILDSKRYHKEEQIAIVEKLTLKWGTDVAREGSFAEVDLLLVDIRQYLDYTVNLENRVFLHQMIEAAYTSEIYMWEHTLQLKEKLTQKECSLLIDKSVEFEKAALLLALGNNITTEAVKAAEAIAKIMWLSDDLCDFIEDIKCRRKNSLLFVFMPEEELMLEERAEKAIGNMTIYIKMLEDEMKSLYHVGDERLYYFVVCLVWKWFSDVRKICEKV